MIYRPFQLEPFTLGIPQGTALLLEKLRGKQLDWTEIERNLIKKQTCVVCNKKADKSKFDSNEFKRKDNSAVCTECKENCKGESDEWTHHFCGICQRIKHESQFNPREREREFFRQPICVDCLQQRGGLREATKTNKSENLQRNLICSQCEQPFEYVSGKHITPKMTKKPLLFEGEPSCVLRMLPGREGVIEP